MTDEPRKTPPPPNLPPLPPRRTPPPPPPPARPGPPPLPSGADRLAQATHQAVAKTKEVYTHVKQAEATKAAIGATRQVFTSVKNAPATQQTVAKSKEVLGSLKSKLAAKLSSSAAPAAAPPPPPAGAMPPPPPPGPKYVSSEPASWHYSVGGHQTGPIQLTALQNLIVSGQLSQSVLVWKKGMPQWQPADTIRGFFLLSEDPTRPG